MDHDNDGGWVFVVFMAVLALILAIGVISGITTSINNGKPMTKTLTICRLEATPSHNNLYYQVIAADAADGTLHELQLNAKGVVVAVSRDLRPGATFRVTFEHRADWESDYGADVSEMVRDDTVHTDCGADSPAG